MDEDEDKEEEEEEEEELGAGGLFQLPVLCGNRRHHVPVFDPIGFGLRQ